MKTTRYMILLLPALAAAAAAADANPAVVGVKECKLNATEELDGNVAVLKEGTRVEVTLVKEGKVKVRIAKEQADRGDARTASKNLQEGWTRRCHLATPSELKRRQDRNEVPQRLICVGSGDKGTFLYGGHIPIRNNRPTVEAGQGFWMDYSARGKVFTVGSNKLVGDPDVLFLYTKGDQIKKLPVWQAPAGKDGASSGAARPAADGKGADTNTGPLTTLQARELRLTYLDAVTMDIGGDNTMHPKKENLRAKDKEGRIWVSRRIVQDDPKSKLGYFLQETAEVEETDGVDSVGRGFVVSHLPEGATSPLTFMGLELKDDDRCILHLELGSSPDGKGACHITQDKFDELFEELEGLPLAQFIVDSGKNLDVQESYAILVMTSIFDESKKKSVTHEIPADKLPKAVDEWIARVMKAAVDAADDE